ncbi:hypothetical protein OF83DRAFT_1107190 [Amylostereum chailletii]|nr:hypothetical protein OF83DRAFT_1107190 [Amylostereum chailletii]
MWTDEMIVPSWSWEFGRSMQIHTYLLVIFRCIFLVGSPSSRHLLICRTICAVECAAFLRDSDRTGFHGWMYYSHTTGRISQVNI